MLLNIIEEHCQYIYQNGAGWSVGQFVSQFVSQSKILMPALLYKHWGYNQTNCDYTAQYKDNTLLLNIFYQLEDVVTMTMWILMSMFKFLLSRVISYWLLPRQPGKMFYKKWSYWVYLTTVYMYPISQVENNWWL